MVEVDGYMVISKPAIKYLRVKIYAKLSFRANLEYACQMSRRVEYCKLAAATKVASRLSHATNSALNVTCVDGGA